MSAEEAATNRQTRSLRITIEHAYPTAVEPSSRVLEAAAMFGLGVDETRMIQVVPRTELALVPRQVTFITGPSGSGKSTILRLIRNEIPAERLIEFGASETDLQQPIIEQVGETIEAATHILSQAGLADAFVMLRKPSELSDGQRYRFALARVIDEVRRRANADEKDRAPFVILADEFGATLDRLTAAVVARNIRRWVNRNPVAFIAATTHDDLLEPLQPDVLVYMPIGERIEVHAHAEQA